MDMKKNEIDIPKTVQAGCGCIILYVIISVIAIVCMIWYALK